MAFNIWIWKKTSTGKKIKPLDEKKTESKGPDIGKKVAIQRNPITRRSTIKFINKPLSNFDLMKWVKKLYIKYFRGVFSRDDLPKLIKKRECGIINLNTQYESGSHWTCYRNIDNYCEYFDSFGLTMPKEVERYLKTCNKQIIYSRDELQERDSVLCGYWTLYYLMERQKGISILDVIHNPRFDMNNQFVNHNFLINDFQQI